MVLVKQINQWNRRERPDIDPSKYSHPRVGYGNPLQDSCVGISVDIRAWWATALRVAKSRTRLSNWAHKYSQLTFDKLQCQYNVINVFSTNGWGNHCCWSNWTSTCPFPSAKKKKKKKGKKLDPDLLQKLTQNGSYSYIQNEMHQTMKPLEVNNEKI